MGIVYNCNRLGSLNKYLASTINLGIIAGLTALLMKNKMIIYLNILMFPVWLEIVAYIQSFIQARINMWKINNFDDTYDDTHDDTYEDHHGEYVSEYITHGPSSPGLEPREM